MSNRLYAVQETDYCPSCLAAGHQYRRNQPEHFMLHVPKDRWPESMQVPHRDRVVVGGKVYDRGTEPGATGTTAVFAAPSFVGPRVEPTSGTYVCDCGHPYKDKRSLSAHRRMARVHREAVADA